MAILASNGLAQTTAAPKPPVSGAITEVNASSNVVAFKSHNGEAVDLTITPHSYILHLPLGETDRTKAAKLAIGDLAPGKNW